MQVPLSALKQGEYGYVNRVEGQPAMVQRLEDLGLTPGTRVTCELVSPAGDPAAYRFRGALISLRRKDAREVTLTGERGAYGPGR